MKPMKKKILLYLLSFSFLVILSGGSQVEAQNCAYCIWQQPDWPLGICPEPPAGRVDRSMNCPGLICLRESCNGSDGRSYNDALCTCESTGGSGDPYVEPARSYLLVCPSSADIIIGETLRLEARYFSSETVAPTCFSGRYSLVSSSASWQSSNSGIAIVTNSGTKGLVTGIDLGTANVTARYGGLSANSNISVVRPPLLLVCPNSTTLDVGETRNFVAKYWDSARSGVTTCATLGSSDVTRSADWSSNNIDIATVGNDCNFMCRLLRSGGNKGVLAGVTSGNTQITTSHNGLIANADVTVSGGVESPITVTLTSDKTEAEEGGVINLEWTTTGNPDSCIASDGWTGSKDVGSSNENITVTFGTLIQKTFTLTCSKVGVDDTSDFVIVSKTMPPAGLKELIIKRGDCAGSSSQFNLDPEETAALVACDSNNDTLVSATWTSGNDSCISLENPTPSETMTIKAVGTNPPCLLSTDINVRATGYTEDSVPVGIRNNGGTVSGPKPAKPSTWQEVAP
ncbi:MAG: hypothetical protein EOM19_02730 [Candidatus Moranbacteria bacterium]|nr:hypothetical protein [Candidatus Moranbacteria bacterium]